MDSPDKHPSPERDRRGNRFYLFTIIIFTISLAYLSYLILRPFLSAIAWAIVLTVVFYPVYAYLRRFVRWKSLASLITLIIVIAMIVGPFSYLTVNLTSELKNFAEYLNTQGIGKVDEWLRSPQAVWIQERVQSVFNIRDFDIARIISENISKIGKVILGNITTGVANVFTVIINFFLMIFALFFLLKDAPDFMGRIRDYMPFSQEQKRRLESQIKDMVISTIYGGVIVALIQGVLGGITFFFLGLESPVLLGTAIGFMSFIPGLGAASVWGPVVIYLFIKNAVVKAVVLLFVGIFIISMVDNILKPIIISGRTRMPTPIIFFSVIGGLNLFGLLGLILGPLVLALFISVLEIFRNLEEETAPP
ncbi:putative inner membrane protein [bacterium BMS3Bbin06]|nr:putative inner membrane protein [bacterium BMS3Abin08]GBE35303.1 putative inner membrane protein [bacterium BMS3Bbin06]HDO34952.1 AI-2E family transporter [Nitrospirota bacterium]HDY71971.1 AI-2E family transporter [Nitrospirota bacterium]